MNNKILVIGSTGKTGSRIYTRLQSRGYQAVPASRKSPVAFDWYDEKTWLKALEEIHTVYITFQPDLAVPGAVEIIARFIQAAVVAGIKKLVLLSGRGEQAAVACENIIIGSGLDWTILRASFFMQNFSEGFWTDGILSGEFVIPQVEAKEPFVDTDDIADVAVEALTTNNHLGRIYELTGPELLSFQDAIDKISQATRKPVALAEVSMDEYASILKEYQVPEDEISLIRYLFTEVLDGRNASVKNDIQTVLQRRPGSFDNYVEKVNQSGT